MLNDMHPKDCGFAEEYEEQYQMDWLERFKSFNC
jgi:hypothetical protein